DAARGADDDGHCGQLGGGVLASLLCAVLLCGHQLTAVHVVPPVFFLLLRRATRRDRVVRTAKPMLPGPRESPGTRVPRPDPRATGGAPWTSSLVKHPASTCGGNANPAPACAVSTPVGVTRRAPRPSGTVTTPGPPAAADGRRPVARTGRHPRGRPGRGGSTTRRT